ncbi:glutaredoxin [Halteromyces radiatus]|uniref:glutaredoxin n=1 Tax=Halteromyces radiatus TaxID=101107 RepID=UPI002220309F|nr:glutaredoxin [Halteromyces radiatus]KAI8082928.1 glutaredoxin [Halteromyces radiatus]
MSSPAEIVEELIKNNKVVIFSKSYCPYCTATKDLFKQLGVTVVVIELDERQDGAAIQDYLLTKTGQRTVPNVFVAQKHIGGNDKVQAANKDGTLQKLLA